MDDETFQVAEISASPFTKDGVPTELLQVMWLDTFPPCAKLPIGEALGLCTESPPPFPDPYYFCISLNLRQGMHFLQMHKAGQRSNITRYTTTSVLQILCGHNTFVSVYREKQWKMDPERRGEREGRVNLVPFIPMDHIIIAPRQPSCRGSFCHVAPSLCRSASMVLFKQTHSRNTR